MGGDLPEELQGAWPPLYQHEAGEGQRAEAPIYSDLGRCLLARQVLISYSSLSSLLSLSRPYTFNLEAYPGVLKSDIRTNTSVQGPWFSTHGKDRFSTVCP